MNSSPCFRRSAPGLCALLILLVACGPLGIWLLQCEKPGSIDLQVMSFNIRQGKAQDGQDAWEFRKDFVGEVIRDAAPDLIGLQEVYRFQLDDLLARLPQYAALGEGRDGGTQGEYSCILYRKGRFDLLDSGTFWLSDTPAAPSASWGNRYRRVCTWARLVDRRNARVLRIYNTHLDHESQRARELGIRLILQRIGEGDATEPLLLCGDLNSGEGNPVIAHLKGAGWVDTWRAIHPKEPDCGTISRFTGSREPLKIDYILTRPDARVLAADILRPRRKGRDASDHYAVSASVRLK